MSFRYLLLAALPLAVALPAAAADWSPKARTEFVRQCVAGGPAQYKPDQLSAYCDCAAGKVSSEFSEAEMQAISRQTEVDPAVQQRLVAAASSCGTKLQR